MLSLRTTIKSTVFEWLYFYLFLSLSLILSLVDLSFLWPFIFSLSHLIVAKTFHFCDPSFFFLSLSLSSLSRAESEILKEAFSSFRIKTLAFNLIECYKIKTGFIHLQFQTLPILFQFQIPFAPSSKP